MNKGNISLSSMAILGIKQHAMGSYPNECCGLLFGYRGNGDRISISESVPLKNQMASEKAGRFFMADPMSVWKLEKAGEKRGLELFGVYHSHPDAPAYPSEADEERLIPGLIYAVMSVEEGNCKELKLWSRTSPASEVTEHK